MSGRRLGRRSALLLPLAAGGCGFLDDWFGTEKVPLPGKRIPVVTVRRGLEIDNPDTRRITLPPPVPNPSWLQAGGDPSHAMGHLAARDALAEAWTAGIGEGGGYRAKITSRPVIADGRVFTMDSDAEVRAFDARTGARLWSRDTQAKKDRSGNVGGGLALDGGVLYATTGRGDALAIDPASGTIQWRAALGNAARSAPTIAEKRLFVPLIDGRLVALAQADGSPAWTYQGTAPEAGVLGLPAPAYADGILVAGFGTGDLVGLRAATGGVVWSDNLGATAGRNSLIDLPSIRGMPVIDRAQVFAIGLAGLMLCLDLRSGRRLWERDIGSSETPWLAGDWLFVLTTDAEVVAVNRTDGTVAWLTPLPRWKNEKKQTDPIRWVGPTLVGDRLILAGSVRRAIALSPYTGLPLGRQELSGEPSVAPVVADGTVFLVTDDATLAALR